MPAVAVRQKRWRLALTRLLFDQIVDRPPATVSVRWRPAMRLGQKVTRFAAEICKGLVGPILALSRDEHQQFDAHGVRRRVLDCEKADGR